MTRRLYYTDAYRRTFSAALTRLADDGRRIYLDQTCFYPTSGGQPHDLGTLAGTPVVDVIDEGDEIAHVLAEPLIDAHAGQRAAALEIAGEVDWARRFDHMQQHTGQHLLSAVLEDLHGWPTVSVHFGSEESTLDVDADPAEVSPQRLAAAERRTSEIIAEGRPVTITFEDAAAARPLRKPSDRSGEIRVVEIEGADRSACGGTHVRTTAEIGLIMVTGVEKVRRQTRVSFVCGGRVVRRARADRAALERVAQAMSTSPAEAPALAAKMAAELRALQKEHRGLVAELAAFRARDMLASVTPDARGIRQVVDVRASATADELRSMAQAMSGEPGVVYLGASAEPPFVVLTASEA
ncbi:MAG: alanyl-tRNA editing protein [Gemmatimonadota bacterium]|nr:alanyl-tRNA editing protein [Gemmatimonadota bacterium]